MIPDSAYITYHAPEIERQSSKLTHRSQFILFQKHMEHETEAYIPDRSMIRFGSNSISSSRGGSRAEQRSNSISPEEGRLRHRTNPPSLSHMDPGVGTADSISDVWRASNPTQNNGLTTVWRYNIKSCSHKSPLLLFYPSAIFIKKNKK